MTTQEEREKYCQYYNCYMGENCVCVCVHGSNPFIGLSSLRRNKTFPDIYTPWYSLEWNFLWGSESLELIWPLLMLWELILHTSRQVQFAPFAEISAGTMQEAEIRFRSPAEGWEGLILVKTEDNYSNLRTMKYCNLPPCKFFLGLFIQLYLHWWHTL